MVGDSIVNIGLSDMHLVYTQNYQAQNFPTNKLFQIL